VGTERLFRLRQGKKILFVKYLHAGSDEFTLSTELTGHNTLTSDGLSSGL
jgi:hypothetical protein